MRVYIEPLRQRETIRRLLQQQGWRLHQEERGYTAHHEAVRDEQTARRLLQHLGLLTSSSVRIEFERLRRRQRAHVGFTG
jgi:hypothetical protein